MQMDSYYYASFHDEAAFYPHGAAPASPELPFGLIASPEEPPQAPRPSAFRDYSGAGPELPPAGARPPHGSGENVHRRVIGALGRMGGGSDQTMEEAEVPQRGAAESSRGFRHMMRERQRREKLSQSYADLYAMVSTRSKGDKNSIVQSAAIYIHELKGARDQLQRRNEELKAKILGHDAQQQCVKVQFVVDEPSSAIDSMIGALRRLKSMDVRARGVRSNMSNGRLRTEMIVETTIAAAEVERAVEEALMTEVENQPEPDSGAPFPGTTPAAATSSGSWGPQASSHVQNVF
ncbi:transcription factor BHLH148-like [Phragmites australis]|uniref:transcription factor BHLH148-like n=1 Tax=Phragmites australis TaxID=29695 RepID=UPI002D78835B|nr:transcription factor BHLH148-like [Phragmites australis]